MRKDVFVTGITGQDGTFLTSQLLKENKYNIIVNEYPNIRKI